MSMPSLLAAYHQHNDQCLQQHCKLKFGTDSDCKDDKAWVAAINLHEHRVNKLQNRRAVARLTGRGSGQAGHLVYYIKQVR